MTTTVKVHVNGAYTATVVQTNKDGSEQSHTINGGEEKSFSLGHPAEATFKITEVAADRASNEGGKGS